MWSRIRPTILNSIGTPDHPAERFPDFLQIRWTQFQKTHPRTSIVARRCDGVHDFVGQRGSQFSHHAQPIHVREIRFKLTNSLMLFFDPLALGQIGHERDAFVADCFEQRLLELLEKPIVAGQVLRLLIVTK
jgi:hypothetical protein